MQNLGEKEQKDKGVELLLLLIWKLKIPWAGELHTVLRYEPKANKIEDDALT
jgi:hypothetical protein